MERFIRQDDDYIDTETGIRFCLWKKDMTLEDCIPMLDALSNLTSVNTENVFLFLSPSVVETVTDSCMIVRYKMNSNGVVTRCRRRKDIVL